MQNIHTLSHLLIGRSFTYASTFLKDRGYKVNKTLIEPKKDMDILTDELTICLRIEPDDSITIITSMFKKYI